mgnify:FL=1
MKSRNYAGISLLASLAACNSATAETVQKNSKQAPQKPNVIVILADDLGYGDLKCYGAKNVETPHVDKLASEGIRFTNAHTVAATSTPSRYSLLTGEYAWRRPDTDIAAGDVKMIIRPEQYTMQTCLKVPDMLQPPSANGIWAWETRQADRIGMLLYQPL